MMTRHRDKFIHEGSNVAEVDVELIETDDEWSTFKFALPVLTTTC